MINNKTYLVVTPFFPSKNSFRGNYIFDQVNEIRNQTDYNIVVVKIVSFFSNENDYIYNGFSVKIFNIIDFPSFIFPGIFNFLNKPRFVKFLKRKNIVGLKIVHAHVAYPSLYLASSLKCKKIVQHHGLDVLQLTNGRINFIRFLQSKFLINRTLNHLNNADLNVGVSKLVLNHLHKYKLYNPKNEYVLYNGVDTTKFFKVSNKENDVYTVGCVGNFWKTKGQIILIKSIQSILKQGYTIKLRIIGTGPTLNFCKRYVHKNNLTSYISFESEIMHSEMNNFYNSVDLFVLPSYYEALGCVYLEAWATETPFVGIVDQGISELVPNSEKNKLLAFSRSSDSLKDKILAEYTQKRKFPFENKYNITNTISSFIHYLIKNT